MTLQISGGRLLAVDDQRENIDVLVALLEPRGHDMLVAANGQEALALAHRFIPDLILLDVMMPDLDGFEVCRRLQADETTREIPVIFLTALNDSEHIVEGFDAGGHDYIAKPFNEQELVARVDLHLRLRAALRRVQEQYDLLLGETARRESLTLERDQLANRLSLISANEARRWGLDGFVGKSKTLKAILDSVAKLQQSSVSVMISGESGTGKELVARAVHFGSERAQAPFVPVNCSAIPHELADSLFFGHIKGAFTGADDDRPGYFAQADGGTLFLDEIGDMPLDLQAKLLRVLEARAVMPVGGTEERPVDVRVVSATHVDLQEAVQRGAFRQDLYYRLAGFPVAVPALRERRGDIPLLVQHFLELLAAEMGTGVASMSEEALAVLAAYEFPGNIRELKNIVERALIDSGGGEIEPRHLYLDAALAPTAAPMAATAADLPLNVAEAELALIQRALAQTKGNVLQSSKLLGISRARLYRRLAQAAGDAGDGGIATFHSSKNP